MAAQLEAKTGAAAGSTLSELLHTLLHLFCDIEKNGKLTFMNFVYTCLNLNYILERRVT